MAGCIYRPYHDSLFFSRKGEERAQRNLNEAEKIKRSLQRSPIIECLQRARSIVFYIGWFISQAFCMPEKCPVGSYYLKRAPESIHLEVSLCQFIMASVPFMNILCTRGVQQAHSIDFNIVLIVFGGPSEKWLAGSLYKF